MHDLKSTDTPQLRAHPPPAHRQRQRNHKAQGRVHKRLDSAALPVAYTHYTATWSQSKHALELKATTFSLGLSVEQP